MKTLNFLILLFLFLIVSCQNEVIDENPLADTEMNITQSHEQFAKILAKAVTNEKVRAFLKEQALKEVDNDYDVVYHFIKNEKVDGEHTFREVLAQYSGTAEVLDDITNHDRLLTILVPSLSDEFSAKKWDIENQIPKIAVANAKSDKLSTYGVGDSCMLSKKTKPDFPTLVVKTNERLCSGLASSSRSVNLGGSLKNNDFFAYFLDEAFNNTNMSTRARQTRAVEMDTTTIMHLLDKKQKLYSSILLNKECVRDYIYYSISPTLNIVKGTLDPEYHEFITSIQFNSYSILDHVGDGSDPLGDWTDGNLEINFDFLFVNNVSGASTINKILSVKIDDLFRENETFRYTLPNPIEVFCWDMYTYGNIYKIVVSEYDSGNVIEKSESISSSFGTNFETDVSGGFGPVKMGVKFGMTTSETKQSSVKITSTNNSDPLGSVVVNFFDPIYTNDKIYIDVYLQGTGSTGAHLEFERGGYNELRRMVDFKWPAYFAYFEDITKYQNYQSNTGMVTLNVEPRRIYQ